jgi:ribosomal-protein-alanine N-acetyltransferase
MESLETQRLLLRKISLQDSEFIFQLTNEPGWLRFIGDKNIRSVEDAGTYIKASILASYEENGFGVWLVELKERDSSFSASMIGSTAIGTCGLINRSTLEGIDLGFAFFASQGGHGYAFEAAQAVVEYARNKIKLSRLLAISQPDNERSIHLLGKLGFNVKGPINLPTADGTATENLQLFEQFLSAEV